MPTIRIDPGLEMNYRVDDYTDPWSKPETILLLHGKSESSAVWFAWVPHLARHFRVVRPDMRGFGASTPMPRDHRWSLDGIIDDFMILMNTLDTERFHLIGAKLGGTIARRFAARCPDRIRTLTVAGTPPPNFLMERVSEQIAEYEKEEGASIARKSMANRLGSRFPSEGIEWFANLMGRTAVSTQVSFISTMSPSLDITAELPRITCPTLVITSEGSALGTVETTRAWQEKIPHSRLLVLPGDSYHVAASDADRCARETMDFISRAAAGTA